MWFLIGLIVGASVKVEPCKAPCPSPDPMTMPWWLWVGIVGVSLVLSVLFVWKVNPFNQAAVEQERHYRRVERAVREQIRRQRPT